jgi:hypothetical protein
MRKRILFLSALFVAMAVAQEGNRTVAIRADTVSPMNIIPTFDNGYLAIYEPGGFSVFAPDGSVVFHFVGPRGQLVVNVAVDWDGTAAAAVHNGTDGGIAIVDRTGTEKRFIKTGAFTPSQVCFAPDHSIWTTGAIVRTRAAPAPDYSILRHYSRAGESLGEFLPRSSFSKTDIEPVNVMVGGWGLRIANGRIGAYMHFGGRREHALWVETGLDGKEIGRWGADIDGHPAAFTQNAEVYARIVGGVAKLDRATATWNPVPMLTADGLVGSLGGSLVFLGRGDTVLRYVEMPK